MYIRNVKQKQIKTNDKYFKPFPNSAYVIQHCFKSGLHERINDDDATLKRQNCFGFSVISVEIA